MSKEKISGSEALMRSLEHEGVKTLFGYPGGAIMPVFDALYDHRDRLNHILVRHEQGAAHAAQGFARVSGEVGVCLVTSGPGATNTITGIADAMIDSTPIVVIAGQVGASLLGTDAFQEVDLVGITQPISKWSYQIRRAEDVAWAVARAFYIARSGRPGPVVLDFAKNAQVDMTDYEPVNVDFIRSYDPDPETDSDASDAGYAAARNTQGPQRGTAADRSASGAADGTGAAGSAAGGFDPLLRRADPTGSSDGSAGCGRLSETDAGPAGAGWIFLRLAQGLPYRGRKRAEKALFHRIGTVHQHPGGFCCRTAALWGSSGKPHPHHKRGNVPGV